LQSAEVQAVKPALGSPQPTDMIGKRSPLQDVLDGSVAVGSRAMMSSSGFGIPLLMAFAALSWYVGVFVLLYKIWQELRAIRLNRG
jgi:hypothetical protein